MSIRNIAIGMSLILSVIAIALALWPVVADAPWETSSHEERCLRLTEAAAAATPGRGSDPGRGYQHAMREGVIAGCWVSEEMRQTLSPLGECILRNGPAECLRTPSTVKD